MVPLIGKLLYPFMGFAPPNTEATTDELVKKWKTEVWSSFKKFIDYSGGPFVGGATPNLGEIACFGYLNGARIRSHNHCSTWNEFQTRPQYFLACLRLFPMVDARVCLIAGLLICKESHPLFDSESKACILAIRKHFTCYEKLFAGELFKVRWDS